MDFSSSTNFSLFTFSPKVATLAMAVPTHSRDESTRACCVRVAAKYFSSSYTNRSEKYSNITLLVWPHPV